MIRLAMLFVISVDLVTGQLNYEGNPLTEYTEYTAEESNLSGKTASEKDTSFGVSNSAILSRPQKLYPIMQHEIEKPLQQSNGYNSLANKSQGPSSFSSIQSLRSKTEGTSARQFQASADQNAPIDSAELALSSFLNSKTPEESRISLEHYLRSQPSPDDQPRLVSPSDATNRDNSLEQYQPVIQQQPVSQIQQRQPVLPQVDQRLHLTPQPEQGQFAPQVVSQIDQRQRLAVLPSTGHGFGYAGQPALVHPPVGIPARVLAPGTLQPIPFMAPNFQARNDMLNPAMWRQRMRRIRGQPFPFAQPSITPGIYKESLAVPFKRQAPVEVIYTKPPGFHRGPPVLNDPYEDTGPWASQTSNYPPNSKDVYYSQLYAQSYDPHYYNYIAATGKIRPHLYGKLGKRKEDEEDNGIWSELYRGFTKHGLKNIMTPTFLLGMTIPVMTLMLSALVQKRSIARSDARELEQEGVLQESLERLQRAMECYGNRNSRDAKLDEC